MNKNILLCGVGGQGTVLASKIIAAAAMEEGSTVHSAETIGMAQRGGSVTSHVRIGDNCYSPLIPEGKADVILAFEPSEAVRNLKYLNKNGTVVVNSVPVKPVTESLQETGYDGREVLEYLKKKVKNVIVVDAGSLLSSLGSSKYFNIAILGVSIGADILGIKEETVVNEIKRRVPERFLEVDMTAFRLGKEIGDAYEA